MINNMEYIQQAALIKIEEKKMLNKARLNRMIEANSLAEILKILSETEYSKSMANISKDEEYEKILINELTSVYLLAKKLIKTNKEVVEVFELKYVFQKLKQQLKNEVTSSIQENIDKKYEKDYLKALALYEKSKDVQLAVIYLDRLYFERLEKLCSKLDLEILNKYYNLVIKSYNLLTFMRLKKQKRPYKYASFCLFDSELLKIYENDTNYILSLEKYYDDKNLWNKFSKTSKISTIEKELENRVILLMREYKNVNYGVEPIITYIVAKEYEIKALRLIMVAKINKIPIEVIKERMRDIYV